MLSQTADRNAIFRTHAQLQQHHLIHSIEDSLPAKAASGDNFNGYPLSAELMQKKNAKSLNF